MASVKSENNPSTPVKQEVIDLVEPEPPAPSPLTDVTDMHFAGAGSFHVQWDRVKASNPFTTKEESLGPLRKKLKFVGKDTNSKFAIRGGGIVMSNVSTNGFTTIGSYNNISVGGLQIQTGRDGALSLNGHRYSPYTVKKGRYRGKQVYLPEGFSIVDEQGESVTNAPQQTDKEIEEAKKKEEDEKTYLMNDKIPRLSVITVADACEVTVDKETIAGTELRISLSDAARLNLPNLKLERSFDATTSDASHLVAPVVTKKATLRSRDASHISGAHANESLSVMASDASNIRATASESASVYKSTRDVANAHITRTAKQ
jgi:hypothetical protein